MYTCLPWLYQGSFFDYTYIVILDFSRYFAVNQQCTVKIHSKFPRNGLPFSAVKFGLTYTGCFNSCAIAVVASLQESIAVAYFVWLRSLLRLGEEAISL